MLFSPTLTLSGNGVSINTGGFITGNNPLDANVPTNSTLQKEWIIHLQSTWGNASRYSILKLMSRHIEI
jgi:hypothetical protein